MVGRHRIIVRRYIVLEGLVEILKCCKIEENRKRVENMINQYIELNHI